MARTGSHGLSHVSPWPKPDAPWRCVSVASETSQATRSRRTSARTVAAAACVDAGLLAAVRLNSFVLGVYIDAYARLDSGVDAEFRTFRRWGRAARMASQTLVAVKAIAGRLLSDACMLDDASGRAARLAVQLRTGGSRGWSARFAKGQLEANPFCIANTLRY